MAVHPSTCLCMIQLHNTRHRLVFLPGTTWSLTPCVSEQKDKCLEKPGNLIHLFYLMINLCFSIYYSRKVEPKNVRGLKG